MAGPTAQQRAASGMRAYFNKRNVIVATSTENLKGRLVVMPDGEDGTLVARLWANDGTIAGELTYVMRFDLGDRGTDLWMLQGIDESGTTASWSVKGGGCGCGQ